MKNKIKISANSKMIEIPINNPIKSEIIGYLKTSIFQLESAKNELDKIGIVFSSTVQNQVNIIKSNVERDISNTKFLTNLIEQNKLVD